LQAAINDAAVITAPGIDLGGTVGDFLQLPRGMGLVSQKLVMPFGVSMGGQRHAYYASGLKMSDDFDNNSHFIDLGDETTHLAAMGCSITDIILFSRNRNAAANRSMIFTNNAQDTNPIVGRCRIYAGNRAAIWAEKGWGGATLVDFCNLNLHNVGSLDGAVSPPIMWINYGDGTMVNLDRIEPAVYAGGVPNSYGIYCAGGDIDISNFHAEQVWTGICVDLASGGAVHIERGTGGNDVDRLVTVCNRPSQAGKTTVKRLAKNGANYVVLNGLPGGASVQASIGAEMTF
jgi:hypothetical protein